MKVFRLSNYNHFSQYQLWLWENIGPGGSWLQEKYPYGKPIPEEGDEWGVWIDRGHPCLGIRDEVKAVWFELRWS